MPCLAYEAARGCLFVCLKIISYFLLLVVYGRHLWRVKVKGGLTNVNREYTGTR